MIVWTSFILALAALLPLINPVGSALVFLRLVGDEPQNIYLGVARRVSIATVFFLIAVEFAGSPILRLFGISLPVVEVTGGLVIASTAWRLLFERDVDTHARGKRQEIENATRVAGADLFAKVFYPYTFPITAGPGSLVVMLTLSSRASSMSLAGAAAAHAGIALAIIVIGVSVYVCYGYASKVVHAIPPGIVHGILRVVAFLLMCIGVQITWNGTFALSTILLHN